MLQIEPVNQLGDYESLCPMKRGDSYSSHLAYADNPLYQEVIAEKSQENVSSTSDYCSIETVNRLSSASNYSVKTNTPQDEATKMKGNLVSTLLCMHSTCCYTFVIFLE